MPATQALIRPAFAFLLAAFSAAALAQAQKAPSAYEPSIGQEGKDVVWVPTPDVLVVRMLDMAKVTAKDHVIDLGSGDGRTVIAAAKRGARALGIEYNPEMVELSKRNAEKEGVTASATFVKADIFESDFSQATVITMFLLPDINLRLRPKILGLAPGTRVVSNTFTMGDWKADETATVNADCQSSWCTALLWIVPAQVAGTYKVAQGELTLKQTFQMLSGTLRSEGKTFALEGKVNGEEIAFRAGGREYRGRMNGKRLELK
ncbi:MAG: RNA methyltransferase [Betaproteobacteria bacterium RIFCSPHIGHO2_12_FULL_69_13]|nr:MAG: RNA methyltransferase [Betaproteobacteria bacterium RIFCSPHIGHO2_12_FULL_69_13]OGA64749.1 MAG: RNA methyltransferase [Betaproteobacteria bacterium RIFCSPLOWO2_12_FULL_68_20]